MESWLLFGLIAALFTAASAILSKRTLFTEHAMEFSGSLALLNALFTAPLLFLVDWHAIPWYAYLLLVLLATVASTAFLFAAKGVRHTPISLSSPILSLAPAMTAILAFLLLGERLSTPNVAGLILVLTGVFLLQWHPEQHLFTQLKTLVHRRPFLFLLGAILLYGGCAVGDRFFLGPKSIGGLAIPITSYLAIIHVLIAVIFFCFLTIFHDGVVGIKHAFSTNWLPLLAIALLTVAYRFSQGYAATFVAGKIGLVSSVKRTSVLFTTLLGGSLFHERHLAQRGFAAVVIVVGIVLIAL